jgi:predicted RNA methylase
MKQSGNTIQNGHLQEFLDSATNAASYGQRQFYTPQAVASILCRPLPSISRLMVADLHFGSGALAAASGAECALGVEIDSRVKGELKPPPDVQWHVENADLTHWSLLAAEAGLRLPFILINPPFSLLWHSDRLAHLMHSDVELVAAAAKIHLAKPTIDSTLASFMIALDRLTSYGEGFMVCNGNTARRLFGDPEATTKADGLMRHIWLWLEIPGMMFDNQMTDFPTAVLYFSRSHGESYDKDLRPHFTRAASPDPLNVERALMTPEVYTSHKGCRHTYQHEIDRRGTLEKFRAIGKEYGVRHRNNKPDWNISIDDNGRLRTYLTPFQKVSKRLDMVTVQRLHELNLKTPISLCVTATSRTVLREAVECGIWRIHPEVRKAIDAAMIDFEAQGAPFYTPSSVQALGWVDEFSTLVCKTAGIGDCQPGDACPIKCSVEPTLWEGLRTNIAGNEEELKYHGKELLVTLTDKSNCKHHFHVRKDDSTKEPTIRDGRLTEVHWHIADLIEHFHIPIPKDIVTLHPERYAALQADLAIIEARINANMAKAV